MKYTYHVITPFSRPANFEALRQMLYREKAIWHIILDEFADLLKVGPEDGWIRQHHSPKDDPGWKTWRRHINRFALWVDRTGFDDCDRFCILADDCAYEPGFFEKIDALEGPLVIASMKRGDQVPPGTPADRAHGTSTLVAAPENMRPCHVSAEQIIMGGDLFRRVNLILHPASDGYMIEAMVNDHGAKYAPEAFVWFNYHELGRWNGVAAPTPEK